MLRRPKPTEQRVEPPTRGIRAIEILNSVRFTLLLLYEFNIICGAIRRHINFKQCAVGIN